MFIFSCVFFSYYGYKCIFKWDAWSCECRECWECCCRCRKISKNDKNILIDDTYEDTSASPHLSITYDSIARSNSTSYESVGEGSHIYSHIREQIPAIDPTLAADKVSDTENGAAVPQNEANGSQIMRQPKFTYHHRYQQIKTM